jgi:hypothetical protein
MKKRWLIQSTSGLLLTGSGLSIAIEAGLQKLSGEPWVILGTLGLVLFNSGLCITIDAGIRYQNSRSKG